MKEEIEKILNLAVCAPSGENCQPWRFVVESNHIKIFNVPERDQSLYSWGQRASLVAHGTLIENIIVAASQFGYETNIDLFPDKMNPNFIAVATIEKTGGAKDSLYPYVSLRCTNRKSYRKLPLTDEQRNDLLNTIKEIGKGNMILTEDSNKISKLAQLVSMNERILFENAKMHKFFYDHITWNQQQDNERKIGFYIKAFELPPPGLLIFKLCKNWNVLQALNKIGLSKFIAKQNAKVYGSSSAMGAILIPNTTPEDFVFVGRLFERIWLKATKLGLSLQPLTGILFLMQKILKEETKELSPTHIELVKRTYQSMQDVIGVPGKILALFFRIGGAEPPSAKALRLSPDIQFIP